MEKIPLKNIKKVVVDGANVAWFTRTANNKADFENLKVLSQWLENQLADYTEIQFLIICDASLRWYISNPAEYDLWCKKGKILQVPSKIKADLFILDIIEQFDGEILLISNDLFREYPQLDNLKARMQYGFIIAFDQLFMKPTYLPDFLMNELPGNNNLNVEEVGRELEVIHTVLQ